MGVTSLNVGAASLTEGQRLVARRRGPFRRWLRNHPRTVSWSLIAIHWGNQVLGLLTLVLYSESVMQRPEAVVWWQAAAIVVGGIFFSVAIYYRKLFPMSWLVSGIVCDVATVWWLGPSSSIAGFTLWVMLYTVAVNRQTRTVATAYILLAIYSVIVSLPIMDPQWRNQISATDSNVSQLDLWIILSMRLTLLLVTQLTIVVIGRSVRRNRIFEQEILRHFEQTQTLAATEERNRIAREMHDVVAHSLTVMITLSDGARLVGQKNPERAGEVLQELSSTGRKALADMRRTLGVLREENSAASLTPAEGTAEDAVENLRELAESFSSTGLNVDFTHEGVAVPEDNNLRLSLYRIVQESLTNALRYGQDAQNITVRLSVALPDIFITIVNDGSMVGGSSPLPPSIGTGKGITGMRERAAFYNGTVNVGPNDVGGWTVRAHLKWDDGTKGEA